MLNQLELFERTTTHAARVLAGVRPEQLSGPTPCTEWTVQDLIEHLVGSTDHLLGATGVPAVTVPANASAQDRLLGAMGRRP